MPGWRKWVSEVEEEPRTQTAGLPGGMDTTYSAEKVCQTV